jgi:hypothetical protein
MADSNPRTRRRNAELAAERKRLRAALEKIAMVCTSNMDRDCNHRMALDFVRQIANDTIAKD